MRHLPLLSDEYEAALSGPEESTAGCAPDRVSPAQQKQSREDKEEDGAHPADDDMETARTRPLRFDRLPIRPI